MAFNEDSSASGHEEPWIQWFCGLKGHEMFCEVERSYIEDGFNLYGLRACVSNFSDCLDLILDRIGPDDSDDSHLTQSACTLYGLIHARYVITAHGLDAMYTKYAAKEFGTCPLVQCAGQPVLPVGLKDEMGVDTVKIYCPKCSQVYHPPPIRSSRTGNASGVDGAAFGTTFPHLFLMTFSNLVPDPIPVESAYVPRVFGFRVHKSARQRTPNEAAAVAAAAVALNNPITRACAAAAAAEEEAKGKAGNDVHIGNEHNLSLKPPPPSADAVASMIDATSPSMEKAKDDRSFGSGAGSSKTPPPEDDVRRQEKRPREDVNGNGPVFLLENNNSPKRTKTKSASA